MIRAEQLEDGAALRLVLDAPKANILDRGLIGGLVDALEHEVSPATKLIVLEGAGKHFSFGASVPEHQRAQAAAMLADFHGLFRRLAARGVPTCAVIRGQCLGGGLELASWCTFMVATPEAQLGQPEIKLAVFPPMASLLLSWRAGGRVGLDLCVTGRSLGAEEALALGILNAVTPDPEAWWRALLHEQLRPTSAAALRFAERAARAPLIAQLDALLPALERLYLDELMATHDANEGIAAFLERRSPEYRNA